MLELLRKFISEKAVISVVYEGGTRVVEPYLVYESKDGNRVLHSWQQSGAWKHSPPPDWANLSVSKISSITPTEKSFDQPHPDYNPQSDRFHHVLFHV
ncbi:MAG: hypothetical protein Q7S40_19335 [Opitutaceae bacterium]|nr:hypothetical protein [Opitutaceae bacterium]